MTRKKKSPVSNVNRKGIIPINAWMNYLQQQIKGHKSTDQQGRQF